MTLSHFSEKAERCSAQEHGMFLSEWIWQYSGVSVCMKGIHALYSMACSKLCPVSLKRCFCWLNLLFRLLRKMSKAKTDTSELLVWCMSFFFYLMFQMAADRVYILYFVVYYCLCWLWPVGNWCGCNSIPETIWWKASIHWGYTEIGEGVEAFSLDSICVTEVDAY